MMSSRLYDVIHQIESNLGSEVINPESGHARWSLYLRAMDVESSWPELREIVVHEEDSSIASSLVLRMLERVPAKDREGWSNLLVAEKGRELALRRAKDLSVLEDVRFGHEWKDRDLRIEDWSPWLQLQLAELCESQEILAMLRDFGQTKRIRTTAASKIRSIGRT